MGDAAEDFYSNLSGISGNQASPVEMTHVGTTWKDFSMGNKSFCFIDASCVELCFFEDLFSILGRFFQVLGGFWDGFWVDVP